jgi:hypothetical protein
MDEWKKDVINHKPAVLDRRATLEQNRQSISECQISLNSSLQRNSKPSMKEKTNSRSAIAEKPSRPVNDIASKPPLIPSNIQRSSITLKRMLHEPSSANITSKITRPSIARSQLLSKMDTEKALPDIRHEKGHNNTRRKSELSVGKKLPRVLSSSHSLLHDHDDSYRLKRKTYPSIRITGNSGEINQMDATVGNSQLNAYITQCQALGFSQEGLVYPDTMYVEQIAPLDAQFPTYAIDPTFGGNEYTTYDPGMTYGYHYSSIPGIGVPYTVEFESEKWQDEHVLQTQFMYPEQFKVEYGNVAAQILPTQADMEPVREVETERVQEVTSKKKPLEESGITKNEAPPLPSKPQMTRKVPRKTTEKVIKKSDRLPTPPLPPRRHKSPIKSVENKENDVSGMIATDLGWDISMVKGTEESESDESFHTAGSDRKNSGELKRGVSGPRPMPKK